MTRRSLVSEAIMIDTSSTICPGFYNPSVLDSLAFKVIAVVTTGCVANVVTGVSILIAQGSSVGIGLKTQVCNIDGPATRSPR